MLFFCDHISFAQVRLEQMYSDVHMHCVGTDCVFFAKWSIEYVFHGLSHMSLLLHFVSHLILDVKLAWSSDNWKDI